MLYECIKTGSFPDDRYSVGYYDQKEYWHPLFSDLQTDEASKKVDILNKENNYEKNIMNMGYVQGVCECVAALGDNYTLGKKLLTEMNVTKEIAKKYANPVTYKILEQGIYKPSQEHSLFQKTLQEKANAINKR